MNYYCLTLFKDLIENAFNTSVTKKAVEKKLLSLHTIDIRDFSTNKHKKVDDYSYGGGAGLILSPTPVYNAYEHTKNLIYKKMTAIDKLSPTKRPRVLFMTPKGKTFNNEMAKEFAKEENLIILCGHYEGIDERVLEMIVTDNISIGDYVLTGGELAALVVMDAISRFVPNVLGNEASAHEDTFSNGLLEYPQYTRPPLFMGRKVPEVLLSGNHKDIEKWRLLKSLEITKNLRKDLYDEYEKKNERNFRKTR